MSTSTAAGGSGTPSVPLMTQACGAAVIVLAMAILIGWAADIDPLRRMFVSSVAVRPNAALAVALAAAALLLPTRWSRAAAIAVTMIGALTVIEYLFAVDLGIDSLGFSVAPREVGQQFPFRMSPQAALAVLLAGIALLASHGGPRTRRLGQTMAMLTHWIALVGLVAALYDARTFLSVRPLTPMPGATTMLFIIWSLAFFGRTTAEGPALLFVSGDRWGVAVRRIAVAAIVTPFVFGFICLRLVDRRWIDDRFAIAGAITATTVTLLFTILTYTSRIRDEDSRRAAAEAATLRTEALYRTIVETSLEGICITDANGRLTFVNSHFAEMVGERREALTGRNLLDFIVEIDSTSTSADVPLGAQQAVRVRGLGGRMLDMICSSTAFRGHDGSFDGVVVMLVDVTEREAARRALQQAYDVLRQRVRSLEGVHVAANHDLQRAHESLEDLAARLTAAHRELEAFSYSVSHDLRAPLRTIDGFSRELLRNDQLDDRGRLYVQRIHAGAQRMSALIDALLDLSRVSHASVRREAVDVTALATAIAREQRERAGSDATFDIATGLRAHADPHLLRIALENLIGNAVKFSSRCEQPRIEIGGTAGGTFFVRDNGVGFDPSCAEKLFSPFERFHTGYEGSGIGLAIVQRIIRRHGGTISATSRPGEGATMSFHMGENAQANGEAA